LAGGKIRLEGAISKLDSDASGNDTLISPKLTGEA
jgi:hypothetical protein